jgi:glycosyltransferase involved in cell wall biosynthesis
MPLTHGGGVQAAIAFLVQLKESPDITWRAIAPCALRPVLPEGLALDPRVVFLAKTSPFDRLWFGGAMRGIEARFLPDVVFSVFGPPFYRARATHVVGFAMPLLIYEPSKPKCMPTAWDRLADPLRIAAFRRSDRLIVETQTVRERVSRRLRVSGDKISVIGNCVNPLLLGDAIVPEAPTTPFSILIPSAYYRHKNLDIVPKVASQMRRLDAQLAFEFRFTLDPESESWRSIRAEAKSLDVSDRLITLGVLPLAALAQAYRGSSAVFLPTLREASTAVYPESFYFRRPLVTSDMDFARDLCGDAALFALPLDEKALATSLIRVARDPELRGRLVEAGETRLRRAYPSAAEKFTAQIEVLRSAAKERKVRAW